MIRPSATELVNSSTAAAIDFLPHLPVERRCIILTTVPYHGTKIANVKAIATALGEHLIAPGNSDAPDV